MNIKIKKTIVALTGSAIVMGAFAPVLFSGQSVDAMKRLTGQPNTVLAAPVNASSEEAEAPAVMTPEEQLNQTVEEAVLNKEVVVTDTAGEVKRIVVADTKQQDKKIVVADTTDRTVAHKHQQEVERGQNLWRLDPVGVVKNNAAKYGFNAKTDSFTLISQVSVNGKGKAYVLVGHKSEFYLVELTQPSSSANKRIWQIVSIKEVSVTTKPGKPDVGPGVAGLDYTKVIKWQQNVDAGRELWRLDPMQVAKNEGKQFYGFRDNAEYTVIRKLSSSSIARHGQIDIEVTQNGKRYRMILVRPLGSDAGAIWTTYRVYETAAGIPQQPERPVEKVIFQTDKYKGWNWYKPEYPEGMGAAVIYTREMHMRMQSQQIPQSVFDKLDNVDLTDKVALAAYLGGTSSAYKIGIEKVSVKGDQMTVNVRTLSPKRDAMETRDLVYPADVVLVDRSLFSKTKPMNVTFVDQSGKVLSKVQVTIR